MGSLSSQTVADYQRDGYLFPLNLFSQAEVDQMLEEFEAARNDFHRQSLSQDFSYYSRKNAHLIFPFVYKAAASPDLLDMVESIMGANLLLWGAEFFIKPANTPKIVTWHQDLTYWGLGETDDELTAWIALSDVTVDSGCMKFIPGSHKQRILPHHDTFDEDNLLSRGQQVSVDVDESAAVNVELNPGQVSFHHGHMFHASGPNGCDYDRIGLVLRFLTPEVKQLVSSRDYAMQMRGLDGTDHWIHVAPPSENFQPHYLDIYSKVGKDQSMALAQGADQPLSMYSD